MLTVNEKINRTTDLAKKPNKKSYIELLGFLKDKSKNVRLESLEAISESYDKYVHEKDIISLTKDPNPKIVIMAATMLVFKKNFKDDNVLKRILEASHKTKDEVLLTDIIEILHQYDSKKINYKNIEHLFKSKSKLVRSYLFSYLGKLIGVKKMLSFLEREKSLYVKVGIYGGLISQDLDFIDQLIGIMLKTKQIHVFCIASEAIVFHSNKSNVKKILKVLKVAMDKKPKISKVAEISKKILELKKKYKLQS